MSSNLFVALRAAFPGDLNATAIETADASTREAAAGGGFAAQHYTWADLDRGSARIANLLQDLGLAPGERVAFQVDKSVEAVMLYLAVLRAGGVALPLNIAYQASEIAYFVENARPAVMVCAERHFPWVSRLAFQAGTRQVFTLDDDRQGSLLERAAFHADTHTPVPREAGDLAAIIYTSGTTGRSKGAMLSHGNLLANARVLHDHWCWRDGRAQGPRAGRDVLIHALPLFHVHGLFVALHGALMAGARQLWFHRFDADAVIARLREASVFMGVPTLYVRMLGRPGLDAAACAGMRLFISGSAPLLTDTFTEWQARTGHTILERYGMSETAMLTSNPCDPAQGPRVAGTVGPALPGVQLRLRDEQGRDCQPGEIGGVEVRGPNVFQGYWQMPEKTAEEFTADGWFRTGDVGRLDEAGWLTIVGRSKDLIISGGYNVYPAEIESRLNDLPGVAESAVVGVPHPDFGEAVVALVVARPGRPAPDPAALSAALKADLAGYKVPKHLRVVDELPRNAMGKVQKKLLREQLATLFQPAAG